jgi:hypothetical protein
MEIQLTQQKSCLINPTKISLAKVFFPQLPSSLDLSSPVDFIEKLTEQLAQLKLQGML